MYELNVKKLHKDVIKRLNELNRPQRDLPEKINVSRATLWRLSKEKDITIETFLKLINWLDYAPERYIIFNRTKYGKTNS